MIHPQPVEQGLPDFGKVFHPSALYNCRKGQSLGRERQNADRGRLRQGQRGGARAMHGTGQGNVTVLRPRHQRGTPPAGATNEIWIVLYPGVQAACVHGLTDLFEIAANIARDQQPEGRFSLRVTHWQAAYPGDANLSCVYDSDPRGSPKPQILIIPPTIVNLPNPDVSPGVVSWLRRQHARGAHAACSHLICPSRLKL